MLVITRRPVLTPSRPRVAGVDWRTFTANRRGHSVWIGPDIRVWVIEYDQGLVRLGVDAPREIGVWRDELERRT